MKAGDARCSRWSQTSEGARRCLGAPGVSVRLSAANLHAVNPVGWPGGADGGEFRIICPYAVGKWRICLWCSLIPVSVTVTNPTTLLMSCGCDANTQQPTRRGNEFMFITARRVISWQETGNRFVNFAALRYCSKPGDMENSFPFRCIYYFIASSSKILSPNSAKGDTAVQWVALTLHRTGLTTELCGVAFRDSSFCPHPKTWTLGWLENLRARSDCQPKIRFLAHPDWNLMALM